MRLQRIERILDRFPEISAEEESEVLRYMERAPLLDAALLHEIPRIRSQLALFLKKHERSLATAKRRSELVCAVVAAAAAGLVMVTLLEGAS